jgi:mannose-6-phosphate isomerase class I
VSACLAPIHRPLMLLAAGLTLSVQLHPSNVVGHEDVESGVHVGI